jgi:hypothetical protein
MKKPMLIMYMPLAKEEDQILRFTFHTRLNLFLLIIEDHTNPVSDKEKHINIRV